jgi:hypothetical protein
MIIFFSIFNITLVVRNPNWTTTCSRNLTLKKYYYIKTNREILQHDFQFFENLMNFSQNKKVVEYFLFIFYFIFTFVQKFKPKKKRKKTCYDMCIWMFLITLSHFERIIWIFAYDGHLNHFWRRWFHI